MKTKNSLWLFVTLCALFITLGGCKEKDVVPPAPSCICVNGTITDEDGYPVESIQVVADGSSFNIEAWMATEKEEYSDKDGLYGILYMSFVTYELVKWPIELTISANDTSGIYASQSHTFPVELRQRYPQREKLNYIYDGWVTADFVLKKK